MENILYLITFLQQPASSDFDPETKHFLSTVQSAIQNSISLQDSIKSFFDTLEITPNNIAEIQIILSSLDNFSIFRSIKKYNYLQKSLSKIHSAEFFIDWFQYFLADTNDEDKCTTLLQSSMIRLKDKNIDFIKILQSTDILIETFQQSDVLRSRCIDQLVEFCFQQGKRREGNHLKLSLFNLCLETLYSVIVDGLRDVENESFRRQFKKKFLEKDLRKQTRISDDVLQKLIDINSQMSRPSLLIYDLIELICQQTEISHNDLMRDTFYQPSNSSLTYIMLFEYPFVCLPIHRTVMEKLLLIWTEWEKDGFLAADLNRWNLLPIEQRQIACQIWSLMKKNCQSLNNLEELIKSENEIFERIISIKENVAACLMNYCASALDNKDYSKCIDLIQKQLDKTKVKSIRIPQKISDLQPTAQRLNSIYQSRIWQKYLSENGVFILNDFNVDDLVFLNENGEQLTCFSILTETEDILNLFTAQLNHLWENRYEPFIPQLKQIFSELSYIDYEFQILKQLLKSNTISYLEILLEYWKNRENINHICNGCIHLFERYTILDPENLSIVTKMISIDEQTSGETCVSLYQEYCRCYSNVYSQIELDFLRKLSLSESLIEFLYSLSTTDVENLTEIANDLDELSNNIKTVLDFVSLKNFFNQIDSLINQTDSLTFKQIIDEYFKQMSTENEYRNLLSMFDTCSASLSFIQYVHIASIDREQSKRQRIFSIMERTSLGFCRQLSSSRLNYEFNVEINDQLLKSIDFIELSELRDRARLIRYTANRTYTENDLQQLRIFISFVEIIETILQLLTSLNRTGFPCIDKYLSTSKQFICQRGNYDELERFQIDLNNEFKHWETQLCHMYERCTNLTYFSYQQMWIVEKYVYECENNHPGYHLLKFIGIDPKTIRQDLLPPLAEQLTDRLTNLAEILTTQIVHRDSSLEEDNEKHRQILLVQTSDKGILRSIFSLFDQLKSPLKANRLFFCTNHTHWIEIRAFIYRCFYSKSLHQLIKPELLSMTIQDQFVQLLNQLIRQSPQQIFHLGIITTESPFQLQLVNGLTTHRIIHTIYDQDLLDESELEKRIRQCINNNCILVTSEIAGLGKSTYIREEIRRLAKTYVKFPIAGNVDLDRLTERLRNSTIQSNPNNIALHITISSVEHIERLNQFLYCLILFRCFQLGNMPIDVPTSILIYIELDSSSYLNEMTNDILIFKYLTTKHIDKIDWNDLNSDEKHVQLIANYIHAIKDKSINQIDLNETNSLPIEQSSCIALIKPYVIGKKNENLVSWIHLSIFLSIYYKLFSGFSKSGYFMIEYLASSSSLRMDILQTVLDSSDQFTSLNIECIRRKQPANTEYNQAIVRWEQSQPFTLIFTSTDNPLFIYKTPANVPQSVTQALRYYFYIISQNSSNQKKPQNVMLSLFKKRSSRFDKSSKEKLKEFLVDPHQMTHEQFFLQLTQLSKKYVGWISICELCFRQYDYDAQQCRNCSIGNTLVVPISTSSQHIEEFQKQIAEKIRLEYIFTADNYVKMLLVYLRVQSNLPVLIMGETGCGKTALIQCLCQKILDDEMEVFHVHAGITNEKIIEKMNEFIIKAENCQNKRLWIFFDEFNTTSSIGLLKEIICERTLLGELLPSNMIFLGACNPRRYKKRRDSSNTDDAGFQSHSVSSTLCYSVEWIPETMLEYVWDFGYLDDAAEIAYIKTILNTCKKLHKDNRCFTYTVALISQSHKYIREHEDESSVSLRDVVRFCRFYNWLYEFFRPTRSQHENASYLANLNYFDRISLLSLFLCYYFRLNTNKKRQNYLEIIANLIHDYKETISLDTLKTFLETEKISIVNQMELPLGTAKNRALADNIFVLFHCILNRIPVILCGKAGSSKTLAVQIVISNLRGKKSSKLFFQNLPELIAISYQGSHNCTSESIIKVFSQAEKCRNVKHSTELLPVIVFDEIGLAELSPNNPLKVLHSRLEVDKCQFGFVGLSNWQLDASKMNRAVYLATPQLDPDELKLTAKSLVQSIIPNGIQTIRLDGKIIESLAHAYMQLRKETKNERHHHDFGLRDYYSLIKGIVHDLLLQQEKDIYKIIQQHLSYNFDGCSIGSKFMWNEFCKKMQCHQRMTQYRSTNFHQLIHHSLSSSHGRFLMLIGDSESSFDYIQHYINLKYPSIQTRTLIGSTFVDDFLSNSTYTDEYNTRILMDIILFAEKNMTLFLRGLGHLYDNLYDLFNQNFSVLAKKKYCRIALGPLYHPRCLINNDFYCIVFVRKDDLHKYDRPFLNRFEKHLIDMDNLIDERQRTLSQRLIESIPNYFWKRLDRNYMINLIAEILTKQKFESDDELLNYCQQQILRIVSFDYPILLAFQSTNHKPIEDYYQLHENLSFENFIQQNQTRKLLVYTYTQIYHTIDYSRIHHPTIEEIKLNHSKIELEFIQKLKTPSRLLVIRIDYHQDHQHIPMIKHLLHNEFILNNELSLCLIFHLQRHRQLSQKLNTEVFFDGWQRVMIDDLEKHQLLPRDIVMNPSYHHLISNWNFLSSESTFDEIIHRCFTKLGSIVNHPLTEQYDQLMSRTDDSLRSIMKTHLLKQIPLVDQTQSQDWRKDLFTNELISGTAYSFNDALFKTVVLFFDRYFFRLLVQYEKYSLIQSYVFMIESDEINREKLRSIWSYCQSNVDKRFDLSNDIDISQVFNLYLPYSIMEYEIICQLRQTIAQYDKKNAIDFAYKVLCSKSIYGEYINEIFKNTYLFDCYYQDQLTLIKNHENLNRFSSLFVQKMLRVNTVREQMAYLLIDYDELIELMRLFDIIIEFIDNEKTIYEILDRQYLVEDISQANHFYRIISHNSNFYLLEPGSIELDDEIFTCQGNVFIELSLMNLIELLLSSQTLKRFRNINELLTIYNRIVQHMTLLSRYNYYDINNLEKLQSCLYLSTCLSVLFANEKAIEIFHEIYDDNEFFLRIQTPDDIHQFITDLGRIIHQHRSIIGDDDDLIRKTLVKLESEFLRHWFIDNRDQYENILKFLDRYDLWKSSTKICHILDGHLDLSLTLIECDECYSLQLDQSTTKIGIVLTMYIYLRLIFDDHCQLRINLNSKQQLNGILKEKFQYFEKNLVENESLQSIGRIAWLRAYLLYYIHALKVDLRESIMTSIDQILTENKSRFCSTIKLFVIKQLCQCENQTFYDFYNRYRDRNIVWLNVIFRSLSPIERKLILPMTIDQNSISRSIHEYTKFACKNFVANDSLQLRNDSLTDRLIDGSLKNFDENSFFRLNISMSNEDIHQRLLVLHIFVLFISFKPNGNYLEYFKQFSAIKIVADELIFVQMMNIREDTIAVRCSSECSWIFRFMNNEISIEEKTCPICQRDVQYSIREGNLIIHEPHIQMDSIEIRKLISQYLETYKQDNRSNSDLAHHFLSLIITSIFLFLHELKFMSNSTHELYLYFQDRVQSSYNSIRKCLCNIDQVYIWLYEVVNDLNKIDFNLIDIDKKLLRSHCQSVVQEIRDYKLAYAKTHSEENQLIYFIDELIEDNSTYPYLQFFNLTNIHSIDLIEHFSQRFYFQSNHEKIYPISTFILKRLSDFDTIQYLYPIIRFLNYLLQQFDHRINRIDANHKTIGECLPIDENLKVLFNEFLNAWRKIPHENHQFDSRRTMLSMFLLTNDNRLIINCLERLVRYQNEILDYFPHDNHQISIQSINEKHLFNFDRTKLKKYLLDKGLTIDYRYGLSREIIYDFDEIEWTLRNVICCLPKIEMKHLRFMNYQGELDDDTNSMICQIREKCQEKFFPQRKRNELRDWLHSSDNKMSLIDIHNSLEYILISLRTITNKTIVQTSTIQLFIDEYIQPKTNLNETLSSIALEYIIDLFELIEEEIFDKILRDNIRNELNENSIYPIQKQFLDMIINDNNLANSLRNLSIWIDMFKRLLVRILLPKISINYNISLQNYVKRHDMWKGNVSFDDIQTININRDILLRHSFLILKGLENELSTNDNTESQTLPVRIKKSKAPVKKKSDLRF